MSTTYKTVLGDTFERIARQQYGADDYAVNIRRANPGVTQPIPAGTNLVIPDLPSVGRNRELLTASGAQDQVSIYLDGKIFTSWDSVEITRQFDSIDRISLSAPFDPDDTAQREAFRPLSFKSLVVQVGSEKLFTGTLIGVVPTMTRFGTRVSLTGYAKCGVLADCAAPESVYPVEFNKVGLPEIASKLCEPFGLRAVFEADSGQPFERVAKDPGQKILNFLTTLAANRVLVLGSTVQGDLAFRQRAESNVTAVLQEGQNPVTGISVRFQPQQYFSHIVGLQPVRTGENGGKITLPNPFLTDVLRPFSFTALNTQTTTAAQAVESQRGRMFGGLVTYRVRVHTWHDNSGALWRPGQLVRLQAPSAMVYEPYVLQITEAAFERNETSTTAVLELALPNAFANQLPSSLPWDD